MYNSFSIQDFHALSMDERNALAKSNEPIVIALEKAEEELISDIGKNALVWLGNDSRRSVDCRRIVDGQKWKVPMLTSDFLPKVLLIAPWRMNKKEFLHLFTYLGTDQFYHWDAVNLSYKAAHDFILYHSTHFHHGMISVTDYCNLKCRMCAYHGEDTQYEFVKSRKKRVKQELKVEDFRAYVDELPKGKDLLYCGSGELFVSKNAIPFLRYSAEKGCSARILTNGMLLTPKIMEELLELNLASMVFSVDGHTAEIVEDIRLGSNFETIINNIKTLMELRDRKNSKMLVEVHCSLMPKVLPYKDEIYNFWKNFGVDNLTFFAERVDWNATITSHFSDERPPMNIECWNSLLTPVLLTNGLIAPCTGNLNNDWGDAWDTSWLPSIRPAGLKSAVRYYRRQRIDADSQYRKNCRKCTGKQSCYMFEGQKTTHAEAFNFTGRKTDNEAGFVKYVNEDKKSETVIASSSILKKILSLISWKNDKKENTPKNAVEKQTGELTDLEQHLAHRLDNEGVSYIGFEGLCDLAEAAKTVENKNIKGVFIETGCALGGSAILITAVKSTQRRFDVYDTFGMIPPPSDVDGKAVNERFAEIKSGKSDGLKGNKYYGYEDNLQQKVIDNFKKYKYPINENHVRLIKGLYQDALKVEEPVAFAHIDCDWYESVKLCLEKIIPNLQIGGVAVIDDYYYYQGCKKAVDEFFASQKHFFRFTTLSRLQIERICYEAK